MITTETLFCRCLFDQLCPPRLLHQLFSAEQTGQVFRNSVKRRRSCVPSPVLLSVFDFFPIGPNFIDIFHFEPSKNVWMPTDQFVGDMAGNFFKVKGPSLLGELTMKYHLQQQIT